MQPLANAIEQVKECVLQDAEDGDFQRQLAQLKCIEKYGVAFEAVVDHDGHYHTLRTVGLIYKHDHELTFDFARMEHSNESMSTCVDAIKFAIVSALANETSPLEAVEALDHLTVEPDADVRRVKVPGMWDCPCYDGKKFHNHVYHVTISY